MEKREAVILLVFFFVLGVLSFLSVKGYFIVGKVTDADLALSITISGAPSLTISKPANSTYHSDENLKLKIITNGDNAWYNLDNGVNISFSSGEFGQRRKSFNATDGSHTIYVFVNNTDGVTSGNVSFFVNDSMHNINVSNYDGSTTNFNEFSFEEIQNLSGIVLESVSYGKISFNEAINLTDDSNPGDYVSDINSFVNVSFNRVEINSTALPNFNKPATLRIYNLTFTTPRILKEGLECGDCQQNYYSDGVLEFNVTGFSVYTSEETPSEGGVTGGASGGGGGGGSGSAESLGFSVDRESVSVSLEQGQTKKEKLIISNLGNSKLKFEIINEFADFVYIKENLFEIEGKESVELVLDFIAGENVYADIYIGKIIVSSGGENKEVLLAVDVSSVNSLFDVKLEIPERFLVVKPGEEIFANVRIFNLGGTQRVDTEIVFTVKNLEGKTIFTDSEFVAIETQLGFVKEIKIPEHMAEGDYVVYVRTNYEGETASSSSFFRVEEKFDQAIVIYIIIGLLFMAVAFIIYELRSMRRKIDLHNKIGGEDLVRGGYVRSGSSSGAGKRGRND